MSLKSQETLIRRKSTLKQEKSKSASPVKRNQPGSVNSEEDIGSDLVSPGAKGKAYTSRLLIEEE